MKVCQVLSLLEKYSGADILEQFHAEQFLPAADDEFIVAMPTEENENDVALDIISRNPLYADLDGADELIMNVRQIANYAYLKDELEEALTLYNIAIDMTKRLPILFNSRALCFIRLKNYKRAIIDCDAVINKLDEKNLNAWLFRAAGYHGLRSNCVEYAKSIAEAKKNHPKRMQYIDEVVQLICQNIQAASGEQPQSAGAALLHSPH